MYISKKLESSFAEILIKGKKIIVGGIYKHPPSDIDELNILFEHAMETITAENKEIFLLADFNTDLLIIDNKIVKKCWIL